jgi:histone-lysine N-methyltransferase SETMAR
LSFNNNDEKPHRKDQEYAAQYTVRDLAQLTNLSLARVHSNLKKHFQLQKINARWIPHLLTDDQKRTQMQKSFSKFIPNITKKLSTTLLLVMRSEFTIFEPKRKCSNRIWVTNNAKCLSIAKYSFVCDFL